MYNPLRSCWLVENDRIRAGYSRFSRSFGELPITGRGASRILRKPFSQQQKGAIWWALENARRHHAAGDLPKAESIYRQILQTENNHPDALHLLDLIAYQIGKNDVALNLITKALKSKPLFAKAHSNLGLTLCELG